MSFYQENINQNSSDPVRKDESRKHSLIHHQGPSQESTSKKTLPPINNCNSSWPRDVYKGDSTI